MIFISKNIVAALHDLTLFALVALFSSCNVYFIVGAVADVTDLNRGLSEMSGHADICIAIFIG